MTIRDIETNENLKQKLIELLLTGNKNSWTYVKKQVSKVIDSAFENGYSEGYDAGNRNYYNENDL